MPSRRYQPRSAGQASSPISSSSAIPDHTAQPRPSISGRRQSRVHFAIEDAISSADGPDQTHMPSREDPYNPRWQNAIYDYGIDSEQAPVDNHRPSAATLVADGDDMEPPLDHLDDEFIKKPGATVFSKDAHSLGVLPPPV